MHRVLERLKHEPFAAVAASMPNNYAKDVGWFERSQLRETQYRNAADLQAGQYAPFDSDTMGRNIAHVDEVRPAETCAAALKAYPDDAWALRTLVAYDSAMHRTAALDADVARQIAAHPDDPAGYYNRASIALSQQRYRDALPDAQRAVELRGPNAQLLLAQVESGMGDDDLAEADADAAYGYLHGRMQDESPALFAHGVAYADLGYEDDAARMFDRVLAKHPGDASAFEWRGFTRFARDDDAGARLDFLRAARSSPTWETPYLDLAMLSFSEGDRASAERYAKRAYLLSPKEPYAALWRSIAEGEGREFEPVRNAQIEPELDSAIRRCESTFYHGIALYLKHDRRAARPLLTKALEICPYREHERPVAEHLVRQLAHE